MKKKDNTLESLPNIGVVIARKLKKIDIDSKKHFLKRDPFVIFNELKTRVDPTLCKCALASIVGAHRGVVWHSIIKECVKEYEKQYPKEDWKK